MLKIELAFDEKTKITKQLLKGYIEDKIKGIKLISYGIFSTIKDTTKTEMITNILSLLDAEELIKDQGKIIIPKEYKDPYEGNEIGQLAKTVQALIEAYKDKKRKKAVVENIDKYLDGLESKLMEASKIFGDAISKKKEMEGKMKQIESEDGKIKENLTELNSKIALYEQGIEDKSLVTKITELTTKRQDQELKLESVTTELASKNKRLDELEKNSAVLQEEVKQLKSQSDSKEQLIIQLSNDLSEIVNEKLILQNQINELKPSPMRKISEPSPHIEKMKPKTPSKAPKTENIDDVKKELLWAKAEIKKKGTKLTYMTTLLSSKEDELMKCMFEFSQINDELKKIKYETANSESNNKELEALKKENEELKKVINTAKESEIHNKENPK